MDRVLRQLLFVAAVSLGFGAQAADHTFVRAYDLASTSFIYCDTSDYRPGFGRIITVGSSTTVTTVGSVSGFGALDAGDEIFFNIAGTETRRVVATRASSSSITVTVAVDLSANGTSGYAWRQRDVACSTASTSGWIGVRGWTKKLIYAYLTLETGTGGVVVSVECRGSGDAAVPIQVLQFTLTGVTAPTNGEAAPIGEDCSDLRVGLKWGAADGAGPDSVTVTLGGNDQTGL